MSESEKTVAAIYSREQSEKLGKHIIKYFGEPSSIIKEDIPGDVCVDIYIIEPNELSEAYTLLTVGAGALIMDIPDEYEHPVNSRRAEFLIRLPETWEFPDDLASMDESDENWYWPVRWLKNIAKRPASFKTWLGWGHTVQSEGGSFAENTGFCCMLVEMPHRFANGAFKADIGEYEHVHFYQLLPLYREEMDYKLQNGTQALTELFGDDFSDIVDIDRENYCE
ncbi:MAG: suppressor of fused domain protein [Oscillospiraceae bacterium]|nr:suppressor of fused domain protein [Oscillospiraceae bacterium]